METRIAGRASRSLLTTPEAPDLQALFALMVEQGVDAVAMEVSSHALSLGRVAGTHFAVGAFTNLSHDHLDFHPDMESYFQAKALLFDGRADAGVIDIDDEYGRRLSSMHPDAVTVSSAGHPDAQWSVTEVRPFPEGHQELTVRRPSGQSLTAQLALPGRFNVANAVVALACVEAAGRDVEAAAAALADVVVPGRMERVDAGQDYLVVVDYAHKPAALTAVLEAISVGLTGRMIVVLGAGGDRDSGKRPLMGAAAAAAADLLIVTDDNPRSESPCGHQGRDPVGARSAGSSALRVRRGSASVREIGDRHEAIRVAIGAARPGDAVIIAGKGHEQGQDVGGREPPVLRPGRSPGSVGRIGIPRPISTGDVMITMTVGEIAALVGAPTPAFGFEAVATSVEFDTRKIQPGALFVALVGDRVDGHDFVSAAADAGAVAVLGSRELPDGSLPLIEVADNGAVLQALAGLAASSVERLITGHGLTVIGVTGSAGKTSTKDLIAAVLRAGFGEDRVIAPAESFNNELGHPYTVLRADDRTDYLVLELSARGLGHIAALAATAPPRIGAVLNVGSAHLGEFGSVEAIATAKGELVEALPAAADGGIAILNADDPRVLAMAGRTSAAVVTVGTAADAVVRAVDVISDPAARARFTLVTPEGSAAVALTLVGAHQVSNALVAAAVGRAVGMDLADDRTGIEHGQGRVEVADGDHRAPRRCHGHQRCLQRQPGFDAGRPAGSGRHRPTAPHLGGAGRDGRIGRAEPVGA